MSFFSTLTCHPNALGAGPALGWVLAIALSTGCNGEGAAGGDASSPDAGVATDGAADGVDAGSADAGEAGRDAGPELPADGGVDGATATDWTPYLFDDFEAPDEGTVLSDLDTYGAAGRSVVSTEQAFGGSQSARMEIRSGDGGGFGKWGATVRLDPTVPRGGEVWVRLRVWWPSSFEFSASPWMKFLRLHERRGDGSNGGYNDLYVDQADSTSSVLRTIKERHDVWAVYDGAPIARDTWETYEMYLFVDDVPVDEGGEARVRVWRDGELIFDRTDVPTLDDGAGAIDYFYLFTYWNNESPPDNHCYIDDLVIATDASPPPFSDASGNRWIGTSFP